MSVQQLPLIVNIVIVLIVIAWFGIVFFYIMYYWKHFGQNHLVPRLRNNRCALCVPSGTFRYIETHQQDDIFSISGRVPPDNNWCTGNAYLSADQINRSQQINKPPADDAPPSYEEAIRMATAASLADQVPSYTSSISNSNMMTSVVATQPKPSTN